MFTPHQSAYFAYWLTQTDKIKNQVSRVMASARVDMNPHQVEAAWFALKSPLEKGVLLADEVGLGKTIEASLVMAQKWAEHKRNILLVVPASLRKQWEQELQDKFELPSTIIDSKVAQALKKDGCTNPFFQSEKIIICSYEYLAQQKDKALLISWDLVVFDEAHKLRNVYQKQGSKRAKAIVEATRGAASRVLLSATPMQNNLIELYGLSQVIDPHFFGDEKSFRALYVNRQKNKDVLQDLKKRITPLCHRTLRRQPSPQGSAFTRTRPDLNGQLLAAGLQQVFLLLVQRLVRHPGHPAFQTRTEAGILPGQFVDGGGRKTPLPVKIPHRPGQLPGLGFGPCLRRGSQGDDKRQQPGRGDRQGISVDLVHKGHDLPSSTNSTRRLRR